MIKTITLNQSNIKDFSKARNKLMKQSTADWILFVDSDEKVTKKLEVEISKVVKNKNYNYQLKRTDYFLGKKLKHGETSKVRLTRLVQKGTGKWQGKVHETFRSDLPLKTLKEPLLHNRKMSISQFIDKLNTYTSIRAEEVKSFSLVKLLAYPPLKFFQNYILRLGFLDGFPGLGLALLMSLHSLLVRIKTYENYYQKT